jgi:hypothetical protein
VKSGFVSGHIFVSWLQVCLSLLGTWHGTDASQKWDPQNSSLFQILLSIQGMILISDPYFNEPNVERMRGQAEGNKASSSYNAEIHLNNIRCGSTLAIYLRLTQASSENIVSHRSSHAHCPLHLPCTMLMLRVVLPNDCTVWSAVTHLVAEWLRSIHECCSLQMGDDRSAAKAQTGV